MAHHSRCRNVWSRLAAAATLLALLLGGWAGSTIRLAAPALAAPLPALPAADRPADASWVVEWIEEPRPFEYLNPRSLALDAAGHPHIAYGQERLYHSWYDGTLWHHETADAGPGVGTHAAVALDAAGRPHMSYIDSTHADLKYAAFDGTAWHTATVDSAGEVGTFSAVALDTEDRPHISYIDKTNQAVKHAWYDGTAWYSETVDSAGNGWTGLALDANGHPHLVYQDPAATHIVYAHYDGAAWQSEVLPYSPIDQVSQAVLALDAAGRPHIAFCYWQSNGAESGILYFYFDGTTWQTATVAAQSFYGISVPSLAVDSAGRPHVSYARGTRMGVSLMYAYFDGSNWLREDIGGGLRPGINGDSLALDAAGRPHVSFAPGDSLQYVYDDGTTWHSEYLQDAPTGQYPALALDAAGRAHASYYARGSGSLRYARSSAQGWQVGAVANLVDSASSLALDSLGRPHLSYVDALSGNVEHASYDGSAWHIEAVDKAWTFSSLALDAAGRPHIAYYDLLSIDPVLQGDLKYAYYDGSSWVRTTVDSGGNRGWYASLALDAAGRPHISYLVVRGAAYLADLAYASFDGTSWTTETVEAGIYVDGAMRFRTSLALDAAGRPHIGYADISYADVQYTQVRHAWHDGDTWQIETVDSSNGTYVSLALDGAGLPHLSFYDGAGLEYAQYDGLAWQVETVDTVVPRDYAAGTALALDANGYPHIVYYDDEAGYPKHAFRCAPLASLSLDGPPHLPAGIGGVYTATFAPPTATVPLITWDNGDAGPEATYTWAQPGLYTLTASAANGCSQAQGAFTANVFCQPVLAAGVSGPALVPAGIPTLFTATYAPPTASLPLDFAWDNAATGTTALYTWPATGTYTLTVTATNACGQAPGSFGVTVFCQAPAGLTIAGPAQVRPDQVAVYQAAVEPITSSPPLSVTWSNGATGASAAYSWTMTGTYTVSATVANACGQAEGFLRVEVAGALPYTLFLPLVSKDDGGGQPH